MVARVWMGRAPRVGALGCPSLRALTRFRRRWWGKFKTEPPGSVRLHTTIDEPEWRCPDVWEAHA
jgi:hypothetical protein